VSRQVEQTYWRFAVEEAHGSSPTCERLALAVAEDPNAVRFLTALPPVKQQPNLLFAAMRWCGAPVGEPRAALAWLREHEDQVREVVLSRMTQTNEVARCAVLLPGLALLPGPLAVVEVGAAAGLCLRYDAWRYHYSGDGVDVQFGNDSPVTLACQVRGSGPVPEAVPEIAWRAGLDLAPVDVTDPDARRWLEVLVWPEHEERAARLRAALEVAQQRPVRVDEGNLTTDLDALLDQVPDGTTAVVVHSATLAYVEDDERDHFLALLERRGVHRLGAEGPSVLPALASRLPDGLDTTGRFLLSLDGRPLALVGPHGGSLDWI